MADFMNEEERKMAREHLKQVDLSVTGGWLRRALDTADDLTTQLETVRAERDKLRDDVAELITKGVLVECSKCGSIDEGHNIDGKQVCHTCVYG